MGELARSGEGGFEGERSFAEAAVFDFDGGFLEEVSFFIVAAEGAGVERASGVAFVGAGEAEEKAGTASGIGADLVV